MDHKTSNNNNIEDYKVTYFSELKLLILESEIGVGEILTVSDQILG